MADRHRPVRSWMFVPGHQQRFIDKALTETRPDAVLLDLEDGVPAAEKALARTQVARALQLPADGVLRYVRVNRAGTEWWQKDVELGLGAGLDGICLPKVEDRGEIEQMAGELARRERDAGVDQGGMRILCSIESALGLLRAPELAAHPRVNGLMLGGEDFALDIGLWSRREKESKELIYARSAVVVAATSAHRLSVDMIFSDLEDDAGFLAEVRQARGLGFSGKSAVHPKQVEVINQVFSPGPDEVAFARQVVAAFEEARALGLGAVSVGGQHVDAPIVARAQRLLELVEGG